ncbi:heterodisulfide reductase-related iron-sulfur binding cluster [Desulfonema magnum]|uniref:ETF:quinone oxidoreductase n=1 Tax=Desulfonema magnum TaxID=45655 RepID=A0A975GU77_9BACT|nr:(Fe-S)-binding protein [Desulfonema magnum]QTA92893.1 ETF:quinone oxidoreductase [Desulfonema magnum]
MGRIPYWNISYGILIDAFAIPFVALFVYGMYRWWKLIRQGRARIRPDFPGKLGPIYLRALFTKGILGTKIYKKPYTGIAHGCLFWGMVLLFIGTALVFLNVLFGVPVFNGIFNRWFMSFTLDLAGLAALGGLLFLLIRRGFFSPERLTVPKERNGFISIVILLGLILVTGFLAEAARIAYNGTDPGAFVGNWLAQNTPLAHLAAGSITPDVIAGTWFPPLFGDTQGWLVFHQYMWWMHGLLALAFIAYIPYSPLVHVVLAPVNAALADPLPGPKMGVMDFSSFEDEEAEDTPPLGAAKLTDFTYKRLIDYTTCLWCGRCHEVCPAAQTGKTLSPKGVMVTLAEYLQQGKLEDESLVDAVSSDAVFSCTTCAACMEACPVCINQPKTIMKLRQHLIMERSEIPELMGKAHSSLELRQHPFFGTGAGQKDWRKDLEVPIFEAGKTEYLLWIGCSVTYEERAQKIAREMVNILDHAGVSYGILEEARCTGDPAKQMGNEFLFNELAEQNIEEFSELGVKKIITLCPHCYNSFVRHYSKLGGVYEVTPHSVFIKVLMESGKLNLTKSTKTICYHDPCYLGRRNNILDEPREVVSSIGELVEMPRNRRESFCCGGGGGNYWAEEEGTRINQVRTREALDTNADVIATACPFCLLMITDGSKKFTEEQKAFDIAELVSMQLKDD